ncbi:MAG: DUF448 domain-containing protein [Rhodospirillales bacterium]|nr:DUF448 domain-containing protein [Rhodospirillales bacterium]
MPSSGAPDDAAERALDDAADAERGPQRRCVISRTRHGKERMFRFVVGPGGVVVADPRATLPGRGIWLSAVGDVLETARARNGAALARAISRAVAAPVTLPPDLFVVLEAALARRVTELLGLARRAGQAVSGFEKAREWLSGDRAGMARAGLVVQASDGSAEERARFLGGAAGKVTVVTPLPAARLGQIFGRVRAVHVVLSPGRLAEALADECARLAALRASATIAGVAADAAGAQMTDSVKQAGA